MRDELVNLIKSHLWRPIKGECSCGWNQKNYVPRGQRSINYPHHLASLIEAVEWCGIQKLEACIVEHRDLVQVGDLMFINCYPELPPSGWTRINFSSDICYSICTSNSLVPENILFSLRGIQFSSVAS